MFISNDGNSCWVVERQQNDAYDCGGPGKLASTVQWLDKGMMIHCVKTDRMGPNQKFGKHSTQRGDIREQGKRLLSIAVALR